MTLLAILTTDVAGQGLVTGADIRGTVRDASGLVLHDATCRRDEPGDGHHEAGAHGSRGPLRDHGVCRQARIASPPRSRRSPRRFATTSPSCWDRWSSVDFELPPTARESIVVLPTTPIAEVGRTGVSTVIERNQIDSLPINGRNFISFAALTPGVSPDRAGDPGRRDFGAVVCRSAFA